MDENTALEIAKDYMKQLGYVDNSVAKLSVKFRKKYMNRGMCYKTRKLIILNKKYCETHTAETVRMLIAHEVAHLKVHGHGKRFREVLKTLNFDAALLYGKAKQKCHEDEIKAGMDMFETIR